MVLPLRFAGAVKSRSAAILSSAPWKVWLLMGGLTNSRAPARTAARITSGSAVTWPHHRRRRRHGLERRHDLEGAAVSEVQHQQPRDSSTRGGGVGADGGDGESDADLQMVQQSTMVCRRLGSATMIPTLRSAGHSAASSSRRSQRKAEDEGRPLLPGGAERDRSTQEPLRDQLHEVAPKPRPGPLVEKPRWKIWSWTCAASRHRCAPQFGALAGDATAQRHGRRRRGALQRIQQHAPQDSRRCP